MCYIDANNNTMFLILTCMLFMQVSCDYTQSDVYADFLALPYDSDVIHHVISPIAGTERLFGFTWLHHTPSTTFALWVCNIYYISFTLVTVHASGSRLLFPTAIYYHVCIQFIVLHFYIFPRTARARYE